jgi:cytochrome P450
MAVVGDPGALSELFAAPEEEFRWGHRFNVLGFVVGDGSMIVSDGEDHRRRRASVKSAFSRRRLNGWTPMIVEQTDATVRRLAIDPGHDGQVLDLAPVARQLLLEVVVRVFFGDRLAGRADEIGRLFRGAQNYLESPAIRQVPHRLPFTRRAQVRADLAALDRLIEVEIEECRADPSGDPTDVLEALVHDGSLSDVEIRDQVVTLIGAGFDTTSASLSWMLVRAARRDGLWQSLRDEADAVLGARASDEGLVDPTLVSRLVVADRVMRETLRLHPAGVLSPREAARDVRVGGHVIRTGTLILWSAHLAGRSPVAWQDPLSFDPDRFADPTAGQAALARSRVGAVRWRHPQLHRVHARPDGTHAHDRPPRSTVGRGSCEVTSAGPDRHGRQPAERWCADASLAAQLSKREPSETRHGPSWPRTVRVRSALRRWPWRGR